MEYLFMFSGLGFLLLVVMIVMKSNSMDYLRELDERRHVQNKVPEEDPTARHKR